MSHLLSNQIIQKLVTPQVPFQPAHVQTERILKPIQSSELDTEADLILLVYRPVTKDGFSLRGFSGRTQAGVL